MNRPWIAAGALALLSFRCGRERAPELRFPNAPVIIISVDTLRADHLPAYGYRGVDTPNVDAFRRQATLFRNAYSSIPMTLPSHVTMLTGLIPPEHGVRDNVGFRFDANAHPTIPSILRSAGYATGAAVSATVMRGETGLSAPFDFYEDSIDPPHGARFRDYQRPGQLTASLATKWIDQHKAQPFFFLLHLYEPHVPYDPPEPFRTRYAANPYDGEIAASDAIVGDFFERLKRAGLYDKAIIIFVSDHGEGLGDHGEQQHSVLVYREDVHVPMIVRLPGGVQGAREVTTPVSLTDLLPTVTSLLGLAGPAKVSGIPLFGTLPENRSIYSESVYARLHFGWSDLRSLTDARWQFIDSARPELYDIVADPRETRDLSASNRREVGRFRQEVARLPSTAAVSASVDPEERARLMALGYVGAPAVSPPAAVNPVDRIGDIEEITRAGLQAAHGDVAGGVAAFRGLLARDPSMVEAWRELGDLLARNGRYREAVETYRSALSHSLRPSSEILLALGDAYLQLRDTKRAAESAEAARAESPHGARVLLARAALVRGDIDAATREISAIERPRPSDLVLAAEIEQRRGRFAEALALLDRAEALAQQAGVPAVSRLEFLRGDTYARMNRLPEATQSFEKEIAGFPDDLPAYGSLALVRAMSGDRAGSEEALRRMLLANPNAAAERLAAKTRQTLAR